jgi:hypothetical protein
MYMTRVINTGSIPKSRAKSGLELHDFNLSRRVVITAP